MSFLQILFFPSPLSLHLLFSLLLFLFLLLSLPNSSFLFPPLSSLLPLSPYFLFLLLLFRGRTWQKVTPLVSRKRCPTQKLHLSPPPFGLACPQNLEEEVSGVESAQSVVVSPSILNTRKHFHAHTLIMVLRAECSLAPVSPL